jgi:UDP-glucuronate 4-epimerase
MKYFVSGAAGFIGFHTSLKLLQSGHEVLGYDSLNDYYDPQFKEGRLKVLSDFQKFSFTKGHLEDNENLSISWKKFSPERVLHLAAQAGVRYSIENPMAYIQSNIVGFQNVIELVRHTKPNNFVYASSSSVYGGNKEMPFSEEQKVDNPISLYASTKLSNELVAKCYSHLYDIPTTGLRFFTVYGPFGRPDMALFIFADKLMQDKPLPVFNGGKMFRDFTYIDDIVTGILSALETPQKGAVYNLGRGKKENLMDYIDIIAANLGKTPKLDLLPMQAGDVTATWCDIKKATQELGYRPKTDITVGIPRFCDWYLSNVENKK